MIDQIIAYEQGSLDAHQTLELFGSLIQSGQVWSLQGHYGRTAQALIEGGWIDPQGNVLRDPEEA